MDASHYPYSLGDTQFRGYLVMPAHDTKPKPAVLVFHDWSGCNPFAHKKAKFLASLGYVALAVDMYGEGRQGTTTDEKMALMQPLMEDRTLLVNRARAAFDALLAMPEVDQHRIAAVGFCFGGLCALDLARSGIESLLGAVSFHGLLQQPEVKTQPHPSTKILVLHGYDDPMVKPEAVQAFCEEMRAAGMEWQLHMYGKTQHAFSNPDANDAAMGTIYNPVAEQRSMQSMVNFLQSIL